MRFAHPPETAPYQFSAHNRALGGGSPAFPQPSKLTILAGHFPKTPVYICRKCLSWSLVIGAQRRPHWTLDMTFREDESRIRGKKIRENFAWLNRLALSLLKQHPSKDSIAMKRRTGTCPASRPGGSPLGRRPPSIHPRGYSAMQ
jgi:hypothetical protein